MYDVVLEKQAAKYLFRLDKPMARRIQNAIDLLAKDPTIGERLTNHTSSYKYRVGGYRILYDIYETKLLIIIVKIGPRGDVYN